MSQKQDNNNNNATSQVVKMLYLIFQIGFTVLCTIFLCIGVAYLIDKFFHINLMILFIVLGVLASFRSAYILIKKFVSFENPDDEYYKILGASRQPLSKDSELSTEYDELKLPDEKDDP